MVVLVFGLGWQALHRDYLNMLLDPLLNPPVLLATLGTALATLSLLGLLGAAWRNTNIMYAYLGLGVLILTLEVVFGLVFYRYMDQVLPCPGPRVLVTIASVQIGHIIKHIILTLMTMITKRHLAELCYFDHFSSGGGFLKENFQRGTNFFW